MKKVVIIVGSLLLAGGIIAPKIVASKLDTKLHETVAYLDGMPGYNASVNNFESTWFNTTATINIEFDMTALMAPEEQAALESLKDLKLKVDFSATHGPVLLGSHSGLGWLGWTAKVQGDKLRETLKWTKDSPFYQINSTVNLAGNHSYVDAIPSFTTTKDNEIQVTFSGYKGQGTYQGNQLTYRSLIETLQAQTPEGSFESSNISFVSDINATLSEMLAGGLYDSNAKMSVETMSFKGLTTDQGFSLKGAFFKAASTLDKAINQGNITVSYGAEAFESKQFNATDMALDLELNNLNSSTLKDWQQHLRTAKGNDPQQMFEFLNANLLSMVAIEPQINISSLRATIKEGSFDANMYTSLVGIDTLPDNLENVAFWASHTLVNGKVEGDKAAIEHIANTILRAQMASNSQGLGEKDLDAMVSQQTLGMLQQQGMITATESHYSSVFKLKDSKFTVNDNAIPLPIPTS